MAEDPTDTAELRQRLDAMIREFREAQQRRLFSQGIRLWNHSEATLKAKEQMNPPAPRDGPIH